MGPIHPPNMYSHLFHCICNVSYLQYIRCIWGIPTSCIAVYLVGTWSGIGQVSACMPGAFMCSVFNTCGCIDVSRYWTIHIDTWLVWVPSPEAAVRVYRYRKHRAVFWRIYAWLMNVSFFVRGLEMLHPRYLMNHAWNTFKYIWLIHSNTYAGCVESTPS